MPMDPTRDAALKQAGKYLFVQQLDSKDAIRASRSALERQLNAPMGTSPIMLNVDGLAERRLRSTHA